MKVFVLGGTGLIGSAIVAEITRRSHHVVALSRSENSDEKLTALGTESRRGDLAEPSHWADFAVSCDAIIQVAATFGDDMGDVDAKAMSAIVKAAESLSEPVRLIYTGGCWLYGETGDEVATEERPFDPLPSFAWMVSHSEMLLNAANLNAVIVHPAMVYDVADGGVFRRYISAAKAGRPLEIWGSAQTRWPLIESGDLASAYCDLLERPELVGHYNAAAEEGVPVGEIVSKVAESFQSQLEPLLVNVNDAVAKNGAWAKGPTLDQQMSAQKLKIATGWNPKKNDYKLSQVFGKAAI